MHERQRQAASRNPFVRASIHELIAALERERSGIEAAPGWRDRLALVRVVPSVGPVTTLTAAKHDPVDHAFGARLRAAGKPAKLARTGLHAQAARVPERRHQDRPRLGAAADPRIRG